MFVNAESVEDTGGTEREVARKVGRGIHGAVLQIDSDRSTELRRERHSAAIGSDNPSDDVPRLRGNLSQKRVLHFKRPGHYHVWVKS